VWPLINLEFVIGPNHITVAACGLSPSNDEKTLKQGLLWRSNNGPNALYDFIVATTFAMKGFWEHLNDASLPEPKFCIARKNLNFQLDKHRIFKSYFRPRDRFINLALVKEFIDSEAQEVKLREEGSFLEMRHVGDVLDTSLECSSEKLLDIANAVRMLHEQDNVHANVRVSNFILFPYDGGKAVLIDFDFACQAGSGKYPRGYVSVPDTKRHPDVEKAIRDGTVHNLVVQKEHDWFSLREAMRLFSPQNSANKEA